MFAHVPQESIGVQIGREIPVFAGNIDAVVHQLDFRHACPGQQSVGIQYRLAVVDRGQLTQEVGAAVVD